MANIVVVEDDQPIREMYELKLKAAGYEVRTAKDGEQGLALIEAFLPDLILLDLRMPVMDGVEMLRELLEKDWGSNILVIVLTNVSPDEAPMELRFLDVEKYIVKAHHTPKQVLEIVAETLGRHKSNTSYKS